MKNIAKYGNTKLAVMPLLPTFCACKKSIGELAQLSRHECVNTRGSTVLIKDL